MLERIAMLDSQVMRALGLAVIALLGLILSFFGVDEAIFSEKAQRVLDALLLVLATSAALYASWARATKPTPPLTETAKQKTAELVAAGKLSTATQRQGGFARAAMLGVILAFGSIVVVGLSACTNTRAALSNADTPSDYALVFLEGYDSALKTANQLKASGALAGDDLARVQAAEKKAWPLVQKIDPLRRAYEQTKSAQDAATLQLAIDNAIREAAEFIRLVRELRD